MYKAYIENGYSVMPIPFASKAASESWSKWQEARPTIEEAEQWVNTRRGYGIALITGSVSGIDVLDIDTDNQLTHFIAPQSLMARKGRPGRMQYFFRHNPKLRSMRDKERAIEYLSNGRYTMLPPSIHPDTLEPYEWCGELTLPHTKPEELPIMEDLEWVKKCPIVKEKSSVGETVTTGRNNKLKEMAAASALKNKSDLETAMELYLYDLSRHEPRLFTDPKEQYRAKTEDEAKLAALQLAVSVRLSLLKSKAFDRFPTSSGVGIDILLNSAKFQPRPYPEPKGILALLVQLANDSSSFDVTDIALGGAISFMLALCSNRFVLDHKMHTAPNLYTFIIARSSLGKNIPLEIAAHLSTVAGIEGPADWASTVGIYQGLSKKQQRLDVIDEIGETFKKIRDGEGAFSGAYEILNKLYSASLSEYRGDAISGKETNHRGRVRNPHLNILGGTTRMALERMIDSRMIFDGFFGRSAVFIQHNTRAREFKSYWKTSKELKELETFTQWFVEQYPIQQIGRLNNVFLNLDPSAYDKQNEDWGHWIAHRLLGLTDEAKALMDVYEDKYSALYLSLADDDPKAAMVGRRKELLRKFALAHCVSRDPRELGKSKIQTEDVEWAYQTVEAMWHNSRIYFEHGVSEGLYDRVQNLVLKYLDEKGTMLESEVKRKLRKIKPSEAQAVIEHLLSLEVIDRGFEMRNGKECSVLYLRNRSVETKTIQ